MGYYSTPSIALAHAKIRDIKEKLAKLDPQSLFTQDEKRKLDRELQGAEEDLDYALTCYYGYRR